MNVVHNFEEIVGKADMNAWAVNELVECVVIELFDEVAEEDLILMHRAIVPLLEIVHFNVKQLIGLFAGALCVLALGDVKVDHANHGHSLLLVPMGSPGKVGHLVNLYESIDVGSKLLDARFHEAFNAVLSKTPDKESYHWDAYYDDDYVAVNFEEFH